MYCLIWIFDVAALSTIFLWTDSLIITIIIVIIIVAITPVDIINKGTGQVADQDDKHYTPVQSAPPLPIPSYKYHATDGPYLPLCLKQTQGSTPSPTTNT